MIFKSILLLKSIPNLGSSGDIIKVRGGYARNFLLPNSLAIIISRKNSKYIAHKKSIIMKKNILKENHSKELYEKLDKLELTIHSDITSKGKLFGSISAKDISNHLKLSDIVVDYKQVIIENSIKSIGRHKVRINLGFNIESLITINVVN